MKNRLFIILVLLLSMVLSIGVGYLITRFLFSKYVQPLSISSSELRDYEDLWLAVSIVCDILIEYHKRMQEKGDTFVIQERNWINQTAQPTLLKVRDQIIKKLDNTGKRPEKINNLIRQFQYLCERLNTMFQFPGDISLKNTAYVDFYQYLQKMNALIEQENLHRIIPLNRTMIRFQKVL